MEWMAGGTRIADCLSYLAFSEWFRVRNQRSHAVLSSHVPSGIILLFPIPRGRRARRAQAVHAGFCGRPVWRSGSSGERSQELVLQLVVFRCLRRDVCDYFCRKLYTRKALSSTVFTIKLIMTLSTLQLVVVDTYQRPISIATLLANALSSLWFELNLDRILQNNIWITHYLEIAISKKNLTFLTININI